MNLHSDSEQGVWERGIEIFKDRIQGRFFDAIEESLDDPNKNGFAVMAIGCLLVETLYQFKEGFSSSPSGLYKLHELLGVQKEKLEKDGKIFAVRHTEDFMRCLDELIRKLEKSATPVAQM